MKSVARTICFNVLLLLFTSASCFGTTAPQWVNIKNKPAIDIREGQVVTGGSVDQSSKVNAVIASATLVGASIHIGTGTVYINGTVTVTCDIISPMRNGGFVFGPNGALLIRANNVRLFGLTVDASNYNHAIFSRNPVTTSHGYDNTVIDSCTLKNTKGSALVLYSSNNSIIQNCFISDVEYDSTLNNADGIIILGGKDNRIENNNVSDFRRIGIALDFDPSSGETNYGAVVSNNTVYNAHDCDDSAAEWNAGIWLEATDGGTVENNRVYDIGGNPGQASGRVCGIRLAGSVTNGTSFLISRNSVHMGGSGSAIMQGMVGQTNHSLVTVDSNSLASFTVGVLCQGGSQSAIISNNHFSDVDISTSTSGLVNYRLDYIGNTQLSILNNTKGNIRYTDVSSYASDINFVVYAPQRTHIENQYEWGISCRDFPLSPLGEMLSIKDSKIYLGSLGGIKGISGRIFSAKNVHFYPFPGRDIRPRIAGTYLNFESCLFSGDTTPLVVENGGDAKYVGCHWDDGITIVNETTASHTVVLSGCISDGILSGNGWYIHNGAKDGVCLIANGNQIRKGVAGVSNCLASGTNWPEFSIISNNLYPLGFNLVTPAVVGVSSMTANTPVSW